MKKKLPQSMKPEPVVPVCPISKSPETQPLCQVDGFDIWRCPESATDFVWPMPTDKTLKELYDREAWFEGGERGGYSDYDAQTEPSLHLVKELLDRFPGGSAGLSVLDIGCGYGTHLRLAADRGWRCFGIEPSAHARSVAQQRHGDRLTVVEQAEDLFPDRFDLILMFEVIEHLQDPYKLFFTLFGRGAIGPQTLVVISTPNARSTDAVTDPAGWAYRHPPSHLVFYSAKSLQVLLRRLLFKDVNVHAIVPLPARQAVRFDDEQPSINDEMSGFLGIVAEARGSDFKEFMHERYVPGAYWKLTEYEHFPRYSLATRLAQGAKVLDFGCGTGYGTALLGEVAESATGMDIAEEAIKWASQTHRKPNLSFIRRSDLGRGLPQGAFDLVTCFEMIEHVNHETQLETIRSIAHLLTPAGKLIISTPDPQFTAAYGDNPYHLREMTEPEFIELLQEGFKHVTVLRQWVRPSVFIGRQSIPGVEPVMFDALSQGVSADAPVGFVAICSNQPIENLPQLCQFDTSADFNRQTLENEHKLNRLRYENYTLTDGKHRRESSIVELQKQVQSLNEATTWLESQRLAWESAALEREGSMAELQKQVQSLNEATAWLESQRLAWEQRASEWEQRASEHWQLASERAQSIADLNARVHEFEERVTSLELQRAERDENIAALVAEQTRLINSLSWKFTKPLRYLRRKLVTRPYDFMRRTYQHWHGRYASSKAPIANVATMTELGNKHKILLVIHEFSRTGAPRAVLYLAQALFALRGIRPLVVSPEDGPIREEFERAGFPTQVIPALFTPRTEAESTGKLVAAFASVIVTSLSAYPFMRFHGDLARHLTWWIHEEAQGFVHIAENYASDLPALFAACDAVWLGSPLCLAPAAHYVPNEKLHLLVYGCDDISMPHRPHPSGRMVFTIVGSVEPRKGQDIFLDAIELLPAELRAKAIFRIVGSPYSEWTARFHEKILARASQMAEVECIANVPFQALRELYAETDVVVCASRADPMPISITQGLMFSKACLCSSAIGHADLLADGKDGLIFENESAAALAEKIAWAIQNSTAVTAIGVEGRKIYEKHFLMSAFVDNVKNLLQDQRQ